VAVVVQGGLLREFLEPQELVQQVELVVLEAQAVVAVAVVL
jgi:hypothetical protein